MIPCLPQAGASISAHIRFYNMEQKNLILVLGLIVALIIIVIYFGFLSGGEVIVAPKAGEKLDLMELQALSGINLDIDFFKNEPFSSLAVYGDIPIIPEPEGRANPFVPY